MCFCFHCPCPGGTWFYLTSVRKHSAMVPSLSSLVCPTSLCSSPPHPGLHGDLKGGCWQGSFWDTRFFMFQKGCCFFPSFWPSSSSSFRPSSSFPSPLPLPSPCPPLLPPLLPSPSSGPPPLPPPPCFPLTPPRLLLSSFSYFFPFSPPPTFLFCFCFEIVLRNPGSP